MPAPFQEAAAMTEITDWNSAYQLCPYWDKDPHPQVVQLDDLLRTHGVQHILDLGCGDGRHLIYLARQGYTTYGLDIAWWGLRRSQEWLVREGLHAHLACGDMVALPWSDESLDAVLSIQVIYHATLAAMQQALQEVHRILRRSGLLFATFLQHPPVGRDMDEHVEIEPRTYARREGFEQGILHHFCTHEELSALLHRFDLLRFEATPGGKYHSVVAQKG
jgi:SAM-dependent methyltransferase